ncbi:MAG: UbiA family prenyltransferase [Planctomycetes bacterium]|nr:UbiA family prenyltransferase [Planctomycetota bacterium]
MAQQSDEPCRHKPSVDSPLYAWLQMLRPPNLLTVPGDPLAGYLLASTTAGAAAHVGLGPVVLAAIAGLLLYAGGLLQNDYFDLAEDRLQRPSRPLPSGRANPRIAITAAFAMGSLGVLGATVASSASGLAAAALFICMTAYNAGGKRLRGIGVILMGTCRGLNLLIGAALLGYAGLRPPTVALSAVGMLLLVASITRIASGETQAARLGMQRWLPALALAAWLTPLSALFPLASHSERWVAIGLSGWAVVWMVYCGSLLEGRPAPALVQATIGRFVSGLLFVQAALSAHGEPLGLVVSAGLLLAWPVSRWAGKRFYAS